MTPEPEIQPLDLERAAATVAADRPGAPICQPAQAAWIALHLRLSARTPRPDGDNQAVRS